MVTFKHIYKSYGKRNILEDSSCTFAEAKVSLILAPSGTGKSTLLNLIAGLDRPDSGEIEVMGNKLSTLSDEELADFRLSSIGFVFQFFNFLNSLPLIKNILMPQSLKTSSNNEDKALKLCKEFGIENVANSWPETVSGGELQRAAICRALINDPKILLADEPTGNLDRKNAQLIFNHLLTIARERKKTVIIVSHDASFKKDVDHCYTIEDKKIIQIK